ncbi:MAG: hypothetical protein QOF09_4792 [Alphaproteobacteria bacterium]|jgi:hypothetical protein|nr:hypothetical protein [Alphaproteobacteria bacterium]
MDIMSRRVVLTTVMSVIALAWGGAILTTETQAADKRVALHGYDPVSYFTDARPEQGSPRFTFAFDDAVYWFRDAEHRAVFAADPERYAPQYDGYCAVSMSAGMKAEPDPEAWAIAEGKLYVFGAKRAAIVFAQNQTGVVSQANANWQTLRKAH